MGRVLARSVGIGTAAAPPKNSEPIEIWTTKHIAPYMRCKNDDEVTITLDLTLSSARMLIPISIIRKLLGRDLEVYQL